MGRFSGAVRVGHPGASEVSSCRPRKLRATSALVALCGRDRLPWVETASGQDKFAPLASLTWQVHVYGKPRPGVAEACGELRLPFHPFAWRQGMRGAGLLRSALYLVRPDGYVALADAHAHPGKLPHYFEECGSAGQQNGVSVR
jgi:hypothetical protein